MIVKENKEQIKEVHCYTELSVVDLREFCSKNFVKLFILMVKALLPVNFIRRHFTTKLSMLRHTMPIKKCEIAPAIGLYIFLNLSLSHWPGT